MKCNSKMPGIIIKKKLGHQSGESKSKKFINAESQHTDDINHNRQFFGYSIHPNVAHDVRAKAALKIGVKEI